MTEQPFRAIFSRLCELLPFLYTHPGKTMQTVRLIEEWLSTGHDPEIDILPAIDKGWARSSHTIQSPMYFDKFVKEAKEKRCGSAEAERKKMQAIAFQIRRMGRRMPNEERLLAEYEAIHGAI
jgi:hypothetical protein